MKTIVEALKDLYVALGGKAEDVANLVLNPDVIEQIAAVASDAVKPELPSLTGNAGKFLKVDSDAEGVEWAEAGGGGGGFIVNMTVDNEYTQWLDKTYSEIKQAINSGIQPVFKNYAVIGDTAVYYYYTLMYLNESQNEYKVGLLGYSTGTSDVFITEYSCTSENDYPNIPDN